MLCVLVRLCLSYSLSVRLGLCITPGLVCMGFKVIVMHFTLHKDPIDKLQTRGHHWIRKKT